MLAKASALHANQHAYLVACTSIHAAHATLGATECYQEINVYANRMPMRMMECACSVRMPFVIVIPALISISVLGVRVGLHCSKILVDVSTARPKLMDVRHVQVKPTVLLA